MEKNLKIKKSLLEIYSEIGKDNKSRVHWEFGDHINCWTMIGILETIKSELLDEIDEVSAESSDGE